MGCFSFCSQLTHQGGSRVGSGLRMCFLRPGAAGEVWPHCPSLAHSTRLYPAISRWHHGSRQGLPAPVLLSLLPVRVPSPPLFSQQQTWPPAGLGRAGGGLPAHLWALGSPRQQSGGDSRAGGFPCNCPVLAQPASGSVYPSCPRVSGLPSCPMSPWGPDKGHQVHCPS